MNDKSVQRSTHNSSIHRHPGKELHYRNGSHGCMEWFAIIGHKDVNLAMSQRVANSVEAIGDVGTLKGSETRDHSCDKPPVFVDEPAHDLNTMDLIERNDGYRRPLPFRSVQIDPSVRSVGVVVSLVARKDLLQMPSTDHEREGRAPPLGPCRRSARQTRWPSGARTGVSRIREPSVLNTSSNGPVNFESRSRIKKRAPCWYVCAC